MTGLDSVVTQFSKQSKKDQKSDVYSLSKNIIELQALILGFLFAILTLHTEFIVTELFSDRLSVDIDITMIVICFLMLMSGMISRGMSEGWMGILTGLGDIKSYAVPVLFGALLNPALVLVVGHYFKLELGLYFICLVFMVLNIYFHMYYIPKVTARTLDVNTADLVKPLLVPLGLTLIAIVIAYLMGKLASKEHIRLLITVVVASLSVGLYFFIRISAFLKQ